MATGIIRSYNDSKGFGLITPDLGGAPLFVHQSAIRTPGVNKLKVLQRVQYEVHDGAEGLSAANVVLVKE
jgi:CspA family cold shock protein